jgi:uncharacterized protein (DUF58 family)
MDSLSAADAYWAESGHTVRTSAAAEFYGSREYHFGDPLKNIHWRNTARLGHFMLKEFEQAGQGSVAVIFETGRDFGAGKETTLEYSIKIAASLARLGADAGRNTDIIAGSKPLRGAAWGEVMDYLARLEVGEGANLAELAETPEPGRVYVAVVSTVATDLIPALVVLSGRVKGLVVVLLEGFAPNENTGEFGSRLKGSNIEIISCSRGGLEAAVSKLGGSRFFGDKLLTSVG